MTSRYPMRTLITFALAFSFATPVLAQQSAERRLEPGLNGRRH